MEPILLCVLGGAVVTLVTKSVVSVERQGIPPVRPFHLLRELSRTASQPLDTLSDWRMRLEQAHQVHP